jgi:Flp pilus assembly protein TadG
MPNAMKLQGRSRRSPTPRSLRSTGPRSRGQALVEFAVVFPIFIIVLTSLLYFGFLLYSKMSIINAAREGAHYGILLDPADAAFATKVAGQVQGAAGAGLNPGSVTTVTTGFKVDTTTHLVTSTSCTWGSGGTCKAGDAVTVTVTYPFANPVPMHLQLLGNVIIDLPHSIDLISTVQMVHE